MDLTTATPTQIDTYRATLYAEATSRHNDIDTVADTLHRAANDTRETHKRNGRIYRGAWNMCHDDAAREARRALPALANDRAARVRKAIVTYEAATTALTMIRGDIDNTVDEYNRRGGWTRAYLCLTPGGHVHASAYCSTLNNGPTSSDVALLPQYSGQDEDTIVKDAGYRACTVCYPSAPVGDASTLPTVPMTDKERAAAAREAANPTCSGSGKCAREHGTGYVSGGRYAVCNECGQSVSVTSTVKFRKHAAK